MDIFTECFEVLGDVTSGWEDVTSGVPQGSVLGPILFVIYINDLLDLLKSPSLSYADDLKILGIFGKEEMGSCELQVNITDLYKWTKKWSTELNLSKCKTMYIGKNRKKMGYSVSGPEGEFILEETSEEKDLGVYITNDLKWNRQCSNAATKANRILGQIK